METQEVSLCMSDRLLERVDSACEEAAYVDRSELVSLALAWSTQDRDPDDAACERRNGSFDVE